MLDDAQVWSAYALPYTWEECHRILFRYYLTYAYRWVRGRIHHPLSSQETAARQTIVEAGRRFQVAKFHRERED